MGNEVLDGHYTYCQLKQAMMDIHAEILSLGDMPMVRKEYEAIITSLRKD